MTPRERFQRLSEQEQTMILDRYRGINVAFHDWWDITYDDFTAKMGEVGIDVERMYFSGFWSQGDGACFDGRVNDWTKFLASLGYTSPQLHTLASEYWTCSSKHSGHYYHEHCTSFTVDLPLPEGTDDDDFADYYSSTDEGSVERAVLLAVLHQFDADALERKFIEAMRSHMRELYRQLEAEHDHLTSDEAVLDSLEANEQLEDAMTDMEGLCLT